MNCIPATGRLQGGCYCSSLNDCCTRRSRKHSRQRKWHMCQVCKLLSLTSLHRCLQGQSMAVKDWIYTGNTARREEQTCRLGVVAERINYLCGHSWGESSRFEARPTEAVYTDRKVRGHASKHVVGAKLQGLKAGHQGREWLEIYCSFSAKSCSRPYVSMTQRIYTAVQKLESDRGLRGLYCWMISHAFKLLFTNGRYFVWSVCKVQNAVQWFTGLRFKALKILLSCKICADLSMNRFLF